MQSKNNTTTQILSFESHFGPATNTPLSTSPSYTGLTYYRNTYILFIRRKGYFQWTATGRLGWLSQNGEVEKNNCKATSAVKKWEKFGTNGEFRFLKTEKICTAIPPNDKVVIL